MPLPDRSSKSWQAQAQAARLSADHPALVAALTRGVKEFPDDAALRRELGSTLARINRLEEAEHHLRRVLSAHPTDHRAHFGLGIVHQLRGDIPSSILAMESRRYINLGVNIWPVGIPPPFNHVLQHTPQRQPFSYSPPSAPSDNHAASLATSHIVLHSEQGLGDTIQHLRFVNEFSKLCARTSLLVPPELKPLLDFNFPHIPTYNSVSDLLKSNTPPEHPLFSEPIPSLGIYLPVTNESVAAAVPYLKAPAPSSALAQAVEATAKPGKLRIALCYAGSTLNPRNADRSCDLADLAPLFADPSLACFSVQVGAPVAQVAHHPAVTDLSPHMQNMADLASALSLMDVLVTVDTAPAHLAGGLGLPVITLLGIDIDPRWRHTGTSTPWYPSMHLLRRQPRMPWSQLATQALHLLPSLTDKA